VRILHKQSKVEAAAHAADLLRQHLLTAIEHPVLLLLSGGSSLEVLQTLSIDNMPRTFSIGMVDERYVPEKEKQNGPILHQTCFIRQTQLKGVPFVPIEMSGTANPAECATRYELSLKEWRRAFPDGIISAILGIGSDGHVAGVLPYAERKNWFLEKFVDTHAWMVGYDTQGKGEFPARVSASLHFLMQEVNYAVVYACGEEKKPIIESLEQGKGELSQLPARVLSLMKEVDVCTDQ